MSRRALTLPARNTSQNAQVSRSEAKSSTRDESDASTGNASTRACLRGLAKADADADLALKHGSLDATTIHELDAVFDVLASKDAKTICTMSHQLEEIPGALCPRDAEMSSQVMVEWFQHPSTLERLQFLGLAPVHSEVTTSSSKRQRTTESQTGWCVR